FDMVQLDENDEPLRIHVGNIPFAWTIEDLRHQFQVFGSVRDPEIVANDRGSKGFGFVTFMRRSDGLKAIKIKNGTIADGRKITVALASSRPLPRGLFRPIENLQPFLSSLPQVYSNNRSLSSTLYETSALSYCSPIGTAPTSITYNACMPQQQTQQQPIILPSQSLLSSPTSSLFSPIELPYSFVTSQVPRARRTDIENNVFANPIRANTRVSNLVQSCPQCSRLY
ncbi:unnamed protein product, partial [Didymodactylos carnosus]